MNLQSMFGYCIITQTLNIALSFVSGRVLRTDRRTDKRTDGQVYDSITRCPRWTFQAGVIKTECNRLKWSQNAPFAHPVFRKFLGGVPGPPLSKGISITQPYCSIAAYIAPRLVYDLVPSGSG